MRLGNKCWKWILYPLRSLLAALALIRSVSDISATCYTVNMHAIVVTATNPIVSSNPRRLQENCVSSCTRGIRMFVDLRKKLFNIFIAARGNVEIHQNFIIVDRIEYFSQH